MIFLHDIFALCRRAFISNSRKTSYAFFSVKLTKNMSVFLNSKIILYHQNVFGSFTQRTETAYIQCGVEKNENFTIIQRKRLMREKIQKSNLMNAI